jgi:hypothetical protein
MNALEAKARAIQLSIRQILLREWDPIGVRDVAEAQDEYDGYVGGVYRLLANGASTRAVADHLARIQTESMELPTSAETLLPVAIRLQQIDIALPPA